VKNLRKP